MCLRSTIRWLLAPFAYPVWNCLALTSTAAAATTAARRLEGKGLWFEVADRCGLWCVFRRAGCVPQRWRASDPQSAAAPRGDDVGTLWGEDRDEHWERCTGTFLSSVNFPTVKWNPEGFDFRSFSALKVFGILKCGLKQEITQTFKLFIGKLVKTVHCLGTSADYKDKATTLNMT